MRTEVETQEQSVMLQDLPAGEFFRFPDQESDTPVRLRTIGGYITFCTGCIPITQTVTEGNSERLVVRCDARVVLES